MKLSLTDEFFMKKAIVRGKNAARHGEVPVGAVIVKDGKVIADGRNMREGKENALAHAEIIAIERACKKLGRWRLHDCQLYVTLEPCPMCAGAIVNARIQRVVFGAYDKKAGAYGSVFDMNQMPLNHFPEVAGGVLEEKCSAMLSEFFRELRLKKKADKEKIREESDSQLQEDKITE
jgi:tRNA(adenine34) deaminase